MDPNKEQTTKEPKPSKPSKPSRRPLSVKCRNVQWTHEATRMGLTVPQSTDDFFTDVRKPMIRSSPLMCLDHCPRKFLYEYRLGITPRRYESALTMGKIVHKILQALFMGQKPDEALSVCERLLAKEQQRLIEDASPAGFLPGGEALEPTLKKLEEDYHKARATGLVFWQFVPFSKDKYKVLRTPDGTPMVEVTLDLRHPDLSRPIRTPIDLALVEKATGDVWIVAYKTTSFDPRVRAIPTKISAQLALYRLVLQSHLDAWFNKGRASARIVVGSLHAIIKKPGIKSGTTEDIKNSKEWNCSVFAAYIRRLVKWYEKAEAKDPSNPPLILDPNRFTGDLLTRELFLRLKQYCAACQCAPNPNHFYRVGDSACLQYNRACAHMLLCNSDPATWPDLIRERYEISFREDREDQDQDHD